VQRHQVNQVVKREHIKRAALAPERAGVVDEVEDVEGDQAVHPEVAVEEAVQGMTTKALAVEERIRTMTMRTTLRSASRSSSS